MSCLVARISRLHCPPSWLSLSPLVRPSSPTFLCRRAMTSALRTKEVSDPPHPLTDSSTIPVATTIPHEAAAPQIAARPPPIPKAERARPKLQSKKAALSIRPSAVARLRTLLSGPTPQFIRIGVRNKGCAGLSYHLDYVENPGKFDEIVDQDGVRVLIDSMALFSIIGSEMDWKEDALSSKFVFYNPNIKDACGCGESFNVSPH